MAPALGLYLDKLYFDGYNIKQQREMENDKRIAAMRAADSGTTKTASAPDSDTVATTAPSTAQTKEGEDGDDDGDKDDPVSIFNFHSFLVTTLVTLFSSSY